MDNQPICKLQLKAYHLIEEWIFKTQEKLSQY